MVDQPSYSFAQRHSFVNVIQGLDGKADGIEGNGSGCAVAVIAKIFEQDGNFLRGGVMKKFLVELQGVLEATYYIGNQILVRRIVIHYPDVLSLLIIKLGMGRLRASPSQANPRGELQQQRAAFPPK